MKIAEYKKLIADTRKMIDRTSGGSLFDTLIDSAEIWDNDTCKGYCILAMEGAGYSREQIRDVLRQFSNVFDFVSQDQAEAVYNSFEHGEPTRPRRATFTRYNRGQ